MNMLQLGNEEAKKAPVLNPFVETEPFVFIVPQCCREGWESCKHGAPKLKKKKRNKGL